MARDLNRLVPLIRMGTFGAVCLLSIVNFCLAAHLISAANSFQNELENSLGSLFGRGLLDGLAGLGGGSSFGDYSVAAFPTSFSALSLATAILTLISLPAMFFISNKRQGVFSSYVAVEIGWCWFLWVMWLASAGSTATLQFGAYCSGGLCSEAQVLEAFGFLNWIILMAYTTLLLVLSVMAHKKGRKDVWKSEVARFDWSASRGPSLSKPAGALAMHGVAPVEGSEKSSYPPNGQHVYTPNPPANGYHGGHVANQV